MLLSCISSVGICAHVTPATNSRGTSSYPHCLYHRHHRLMPAACPTDTCCTEDRVLLFRPLNVDLDFNFCQCDHLHAAAEEIDTGDGQLQGWILLAAVCVAVCTFVALGLAVLQGSLDVRIRCVSLLQPPEVPACIQQFRQP